MLWIEIDVTDARGDKHEIMLDAETTNDYRVCIELMREMRRQGIIENCVMALGKER